MRERRPTHTANRMYESIDPMTPSQVETSRRTVADARFREGAPKAAELAFELTGLPSMHRGVGNIHEGLSDGNPMQAAGGAGQIALGALPFGSGKVAAGLIPYAGRYADKAANMTGIGAPCSGCCGLSRYGRGYKRGAKVWASSGR